MAPSRGAFDTSGNLSRESARRATGEYVRTDANACAHRRCVCSRSSTACFCTDSNTDACTRINYAATPTPMSNSPAPIPPRVSHELAHEGYVEMPGRMRGETHALRDASREYAHRHGLPLDHAAMASMLERDEAINEIVRQHGVSPDLPTAHASDLPTPMCPTSRSRLMHTYYGDTPCIKSSMISCTQVLSRRRRRSNQSQA